MTDHREIERLGRAVAEIAHTLEGADGVGERLMHVLELTHELVPFRRCALLHSAAAPIPVLYVMPEQPPGERAELHARLSQIVRLVSDGDEPSTNPEARSHLTLPLMELDEVIGVLRAEQEDGEAYLPHHLSLLSAVNAQLGAYLTMIRLREADAQNASELAAANDFQQRLMGIVGHDLRNPLSVIIMNNTLLLKSVTDATQAHAIERTLRNARRATHIIEDLLDVTKARATGSLPMSPEPVDLRALVEEVVADLRLAHASRSIELALPASVVSGEWDPVRLAQVITNLVNNALAHGARNAPVHVALTSQDDTVTLTVHNEGPPIAAEILPALFDPFRRGVRADLQHRGGLGLGLFIVDSAIKAHGGTVAVRSTQTDGTTFTVTLPRRGATGASPREESGVRTASSNTTAELKAGNGELVMVVDDDADVRQSIALMLKDQGYLVATAANGHEALERLRAGVRPNVILLDLAMPLMDGPAFCAACEADAELASIPVCVISGDTERAAALARRGPVDYLAKPVPRAGLLDAIGRLTA